MSIEHVITFQTLLDRPDASGETVVQALAACGPVETSVTRVESGGVHTDFIRATVAGTRGRSRGGATPTLGVIGRVGGIGARPSITGLVSDADGAIVALAAVAKLAEAASYGDASAGDVVATTHICPQSPIVEHDPVPFVGASCDMQMINRYEVFPDMDAILSVDTTRGNRILNAVGVAITPTVKQGYLLRVCEPLLDILSWTTGRLPLVLPLTTQDITPYDNGVYHLNSMMQPAVATTAPVVGVALTCEAMVPGSAAGASSLQVLEPATRFVVTVARAFGEGRCQLYDEHEFCTLVSLYGSMTHLYGEEVSPTEETS